VSPGKKRKRYLASFNIPPSKKLLFPMLEFLADGKNHKLPEIVEYLEKYFELSEEAIAIQKTSGSEGVFHNRVHWMKHHLKSDGYIRSVRVGIVAITAKGKEFLAENHDE
jgi:restriction system protein